MQERIDGFIRQVRLRLLIRYALPMLVGLAVFGGVYLLVEWVIERAAWPVALNFPLVSFLIILAFLPNVYFILVRNLASEQAACRLIDEQGHTADWRVSFSAYHQGKQQQPPPPGWDEDIRRLNRRLTEQGYDARHVVALWPREHWKRLLLGLLLLLLFWLLALIGFRHIEPLIGEQPGSDGQSPLEQYAEEVEREAQGESLRDLGSEARDAARDARQGQGGGPAEQRETLEELRQAVQSEIERQQGQGGEAPLDEAANRLSEHTTTARSGQKMFQRDLTGAAEDLLDAHEEATDPEDLAEALREAADALNGSPLQEMSDQLQTMAEAVEEGTQLSPEEQRAFEKAFQDAQDRLHDLTMAENLQRHIDDALDQQQQAAETEEALAEGAESLQETLQQQALQLRDAGEEGADAADEMRRLGQQLRRQQISAEEALQALQEIEDELQQRLQTTTDAEEQQALQQALDELRQEAEQFNRNVLSHLEALRERGRIEGEVTFETAEMEARPDTSEADLPGLPTRRNVVPGQIGDSRVVRPQHGPTDGALIQTLYDERQQ